jgi:hypothetical protein
MQYVGVDMCVHPSRVSLVVTTPRTTRNNDGFSGMSLVDAVSTARFAATHNMCFPEHLGMVFSNTSRAGIDFEICISGAFMLLEAICMPSAQKGHGRKKKQQKGGKLKTK